MYLFSWIKHNKLTTLLIVVLIFVLLQRNIVKTRDTLTLKGTPIAEFEEGFDRAIESQSFGMVPPVEPGFAPTADVGERLVVTDSNMSLVVDDVRHAQDTIINHAESVGGYMVSTTLTNPTDAPAATVVVRVPRDNFQEALTFFRNAAVKVTSEHISGVDVTDEYVDIESRLETLNKTKEKFESIMQQAVKVEDILTVQRELINIQSQIDSFIGRKQYLEQNAQLSKITVHLATDELSLPYTPTNRFRPAVIFKTAVRSLIQSMQQFAEFIIWVGVYAIVWIPIGIAAVILYRRTRKKPPSVH